jgi:hypothetical protein
MRFPTRLLRLPVLACLLVTLPGVARAQSAADSAAIRRATLDYVEGWYEGSATRMERALHSDLAKRIVRTDSTGVSRLQQMTAAQLIEAAGHGGGRNTPADKQQKDVVILDIFGSTASVRATMSGWVDYLHLAKWNGEWKIVNVLWEMKPRG